MTEHKVWKYALIPGARAVIVEEDGALVLSMTGVARGGNTESTLKQIVRDHNTAPNLLAALKGLRDYFPAILPSAGVLPNALIEAADDAIGKAEGRS